MNLRLAWRVASLATAALLAAALVPPPATLAQSSQPFADPAFQRIWERYDRPVEQKITNRSWTWGLGVPSPTAPKSGYETYKEGKGYDRPGVRLVQYFDKSRMEITDATAERDTLFYVTNGLLARELVAGRIQLGNTEFEARTGETEVVAGDPREANEEAPTYTSFREVASLDNNRRAENRTGLKVTEQIDRRGRVRTLPSEQQQLGDLVKISVYEDQLGHNVPDKFWDFLNQKGVIFENGRNVPDGTVFQPWVFAMGLPITEPYWMQTRVGGISRYVLVQLYERRALTYTPSNPEPFKVEMGNVGQHYYRWRYLSDAPGEDDGDAPRITALERTSLTSTSAKIDWRTSKETTTEVYLGTKENDLDRRFRPDSEYRTSHTVTFTGLAASTRYYYQITSRDRTNRLVNDEVHTFQTCAASVASC